MAKFKKGDRVRVKEGSETRVSSFLEVGDIVTVDQDNSNTPYVMTAGGRRGAAAQDCLELVEEETDCPFEVGDQVRCKDKKVNNSFSYIGIFRGDSTTVRGYVAIERLDERKGCAQNGWWNFPKKDLSSLELVPQLKLYDYSLGLSSERLISYQSLDRAMDILNQQTKKSFLMNIVDKIKFAALKPTDKILRTEGLEDENGKMTSQAEEMMATELQEERWAARREAVAADIKAVRDEEKK